MKSRRTAKKTGKSATKRKKPVKKQPEPEIRLQKHVDDDSILKQLKFLVLSCFLVFLLAGLNFLVIQALLPKHTAQTVSLIPELIVKLKPKYKPAQKPVIKKTAEKKKVEFKSQSAPEQAEMSAPVPVTGAAKETLSGEKEEFTFELYNDEAISASTGLYSLKVCCPFGAVREYYTYPMEWEYILHKFSETVLTVTLFELDAKTRQAKMQVVILKNDSDNTGIKQNDILRFIKLIDEKIPGYNWEADIRVEQ